MRLSIIPAHRLGETGTAEPTEPDGGGVTILTYHAVDPGWIAPLSIPPDRFRRHLEWLAAHRRVVPLEDLLATTGPVPARGVVALTFDDGFSSMIDHAVPVLERLGLPYTVFLVGKMHDGSGASIDWVDRPPVHPLQVLDAPQVRELRSRGATFGSHSHAHVDMTTLGYDACLEDLRTSKEVLEDLLSEPVRTLAYPRGRHDPAVRRVVDLLEHEVRIAALLRRDGIPSDFFDGSLDRFALAVK